MASLAARLRWRVYPMLGRFRPDLRADPEPYSRFRDPELRRIAPRVAKTRYFGKFPGVDGFMTVTERQALYAFARHLPGPFLEIGSWVGLSTCHIASGIRDSREPKRFISVDLCPTPENFRPLPDGRYGFYYPPSSEISMGNCSEEDYRKEISPVLTAPGGVSGTLGRNLARFGLDGLVERHEGDFPDVIPDLTYKFIFIDVMHDANEIRRNVPRLLPFLHPGAVLAVHDLVCDPGNEPLLRQLLPLGHAFAVDGLLIGEVV